jgi:hypothetical protein
MPTTWLVKKFANHLDLQTFLTATPTLTIDSIYAEHGLVLVYH